MSSWRARPPPRDVADLGQPAASPSRRRRVATSCATTERQTEGRFPALSRKLTAAGRGAVCHSNARRPEMGERTFRFDRQVEGSGGTPAWPRVAGGKRFRAELDQVLACVDRKTDPTAALPRTGTAACIRRHRAPCRARVLSSQGCDWFANPECECHGSLRE